MLERACTAFFDSRRGEMAVDPLLVRGVTLWGSETPFEKPQAHKVVHEVGQAVRCRMGMVFEQSSAALHNERSVGSGSPDTSMLFTPGIVLE